MPSKMVQFLRSRNAPSKNHEMPLGGPDRASLSDTLEGKPRRCHPGTEGHFVTVGKPFWLPFSQDSKGDLGAEPDASFSG